MKALLLILLLCSPCWAQSKSDIALAKELRAQFLSNVETYIKTLDELAGKYYKAEYRARSRLHQSQEQFEQGMVSRNIVDADERLLSEAKERTAKAERELEEARKLIAATPSVSAIAKDVMKARQRQKKCPNWTLTTFQRQRGNTFEAGFKLMCQS